MMICGRVAKIAQPLDFAADGGKMRRDVFQQALARFGGGNAAGGAVEQAHAEALFQIGNILAERGFAHAQLLGGSGKTARLRHAQKQRKIVEVFHNCLDFMNSVSGKR